MIDSEKYYGHDDDPIDVKFTIKLPDGKYFKLVKFNDGSCFFIKREFLSGNSGEAQDISIEEISVNDFDALEI